MNEPKFLIKSTTHATIALTTSNLITDNKKNTSASIPTLLRNPRTTPDLARLIIPVTDTRRVAETRIVADTNTPTAHVSATTFN